jgi:molybdopterin converting factor small subunit
LIRVKCLGHIASEVGVEELELDLPQAHAATIVDQLRTRAASANPGFSRYNTLVLVDDGEAFVPAASDKIVRDGQQVVLIPFSHGG